MRNVYNQPIHIHENRVNNFQNTQNITNFSVNSQPPHVAAESLSRSKRLKYSNLLFSMNAGGIIGNSDSARELSGNFLEYIDALHFK